MMELLQYLVHLFKDKVGENGERFLLAMTLFLPV